MTTSLDVSLVALQAWSRAVRAHRAAVDCGRLGDADALARRVELASERYQSLSTRRATGRSTALAGKQAARSGLLRVGSPG